MDTLKDMLTMDPCYEQHIVSIKDIYERYLYSILTPAIYEGYLSLYKHAYDIEQKYIIASKKNPNVENPGIVIIFKSLIREIPNLNNIRMRTETDRIKSSTKSAELFDDLVRAVCKSNIILLTYNIDHKRKDLIKTKYHENIIIYDFIHSCYNYSAKLFYECPEIFYHKLEPHILSQNKRTCYKIIKEGIEEGIRMMLPMKDILLDYNTQKYEQKETNYFAQHNGHPHIHHNRFNQYPGYPGQPGYPNYSGILPNGAGQDEYINVNQMLGRDLQLGGDNQSLLEDDYDPNDNSDNDDGIDVNTFGPEISKPKTNDFSVLLDDTTDDQKESTKDNNEVDNTDNGDDEAEAEEEEEKEEKDNDEKHNTHTKSDSDRNIGLKMIDISGSTSKKGPAATYFNETLPDIRKRMTEYKESKKKANPKEDVDEIKITRSQSADIMSSSDTQDENKKKKDVDKIVNNMLKA